MDIKRKVKETWEAASELSKTEQEKYPQTMEEFKAAGGVIACKSKRKEATVSCKDVDAPEKPTDDGCNHFLAEKGEEEINISPSEGSKITPKKPPAHAYAFFLAEKRGSIKAATPDITASDIKKKVKEMWEAVSDVERARYAELFKTEQKKYSRAMKEFKAAGGLVACKSKPKDADAPKKPTGGGYGRFLAEKREEEIKISSPEGSKITPKRASALWKAMSEIEKKKYDAQYQEAVSEYSKAVAEYNNNKAMCSPGDTSEARCRSSSARPTKRSRKMS